MKRPTTTTSLRFVPRTLGEPQPPFRFMRRRHLDRGDRGDHPLGGLALVFPLAIAFALALVLATFTGLGLQDLLAEDTFTLVANPGSEDMRVVAKRDGEIQQLSLDGPLPVQGVGVLVGSFYRLADGSVVWVPQESATSVAPGATPYATPVPAATTTANSTLPDALEGTPATPALSSPLPSPTATSDELLQPIR